ncbi:glutamate receptor-like [Paramacrobiotus metropolitanus]|uniref:glutamate receptor-like n=1 Tax=Paramacrobiotus metropolitanus TaxID=2943436 RepID=UPI00244618CB|nr:glutamate receptor-like [Paramacrobiotus metropolitanus]
MLSRILSSFKFVLFFFICHSIQASTLQSAPITVFIDEREPASITQINKSPLNHTGFPLNATTVALRSNDTFYNYNAVCRNVKDAAHMWLGLCSAETVAQLYSHSQALHIPLVVNSAYQPAVANQDKTASYMLNVQPATLTPVMDIVGMLYNWTEAIYVTESPTKHSQSVLTYNQHLADTGRPRKLPYVTFILAHSASNAAKYISTTVLRYTIRKWNIVLDLPATFINTLLTVMFNNDAVRQRNYHFVIASLEAEAVSFETLRLTSNSITTLSMLYNVKVADDQASMKTTEDALNLDAVNLIQSAAKELSYSRTSVLDCATVPLGTWKDGEALISLLRNANYTGLTGALEFNESGRRKNYRLDIMESLNGAVLTKKATWSDTSGFQLLPVNRTEGKTVLKVVGVLTDRFLMREPCNGTSYVYRIPVPFPSSSDVTLCYVGYIVDLIHELQAITSYTFAFHHSQGKYYYGNFINGTWTGAVGELLRKNVDMIVADLGVISEREAVMDFTIPFMNDGFVILMKKDEHRMLQLFSFMQPFSAPLWLSLALALLITFVVVYVVGRLSSAEWHRPADYHRIANRTLINEYTVQESLWLMAATLLQQGPNISPRSCATKIAVGSWYIWALIVCSTYTANLAAFLTLNRMTSPIQSADDLVAQDEIRYGILEASVASNNFFNNSKEDLYERMWQTMQRLNTSVDSLQTGLDRVRHSKFAFIGPKTVAEFANSGMPCDTRIVGQPLYYSNYAIAMAAGSPLRKIFSEAILYLNENGILRTLEKKWFHRDECIKANQKDTSSSADATDLTALNPIELAGLFVILAAGLVLSLIVAVADYFQNGLRRFRKYGVSFDDILMTTSKEKKRGHRHINNTGNATPLNEVSQRNSWLELIPSGTPEPT